MSRNLETTLCSPHSDSKGSPAPSVGTGDFPKAEGDLPGLEASLATLGSLLGSALPFYHFSCSEPQFPH